MAPAGAVVVRVMATVERHEAERHEGRSTARVVSPWLFVIAAVVGALARLGRAGEESAAVLALLV